MQTKLSLRYTGEAVATGTMDVYEAAANMMAFSDFMIVAAKATYGDHVDAKAEVSGFTQGSFITDIAIQIGSAAATLFSSVSISDLLKVATESIELWKHLKGAPPSRIEPTQNNEVHVTNNNGQVITVNAHTVNVVFSDKGSSSAGRFIKQALEVDGIDGISIGHQDHDGKPVQLAAVTREDAQYFVPVAPEEKLFEYTNRQALFIEAASFKDGNKWRFNDGSSSFYAEIIDEAFIDLVDKGEPFAKGDMLFVELRVTQRHQGRKIIADKVVTKVEKHWSQSNQLELLNPIPK